VERATGAVGATGATGVTGETGMTGAKRSRDENTAGAAGATLGCSGGGGGVGGVGGSGGSGGRGGHLCVEGSEHGTVWVCNTHDRIARVDGRFVHWVRGYGGGDRYSLIWYSTDPRDATRVAKPVHTAWRPAGGIVPFVYAD
jgi:hypothetical protein